MRISRTAACLVLLCLAACSDTTRPSAAAGHYELVTVNGNPVPYSPPPSFGYYYAPVPIGDLVLRADGTYGLGLNWLFQGTWVLDGTQLRLTESTAQGPFVTEGVASGDSVVIDVPVDAGTGIVLPSPPPMRYVFRRSASTPAVTSGTFALATINGRGEPLMLQDTIIGGRHYVDRVRYDSVTFMDGTFFRRHRAEEYANDNVGGYTEYDTFGSYRGRPDSLVLTFYLPPADGSGVDRLALEQQQLVRRTRLVSGVIEERYTRR